MLRVALLLIWSWKGAVPLTWVLVLHSYLFWESKMTPVPFSCTMKW